MKVRWMEVDRVKPYLRNPRKRSELSIKKIAASIEEFGRQQPVVCDRDLVIIVGHGRYDAAHLLKTNKVPEVVAEDLTPEQAAAYHSKAAVFSLCLQRPLKRALPHAHGFSCYCG